MCPSNLKYCDEEFFAVFAVFAVFDLYLSRVMGVTLYKDARQTQQEYQIPIATDCNWFPQATEISFIPLIQARHFNFKWAIIFTVLVVRDRLVYFKLGNIMFCALEVDAIMFLCMFRNHALCSM